MIELPEPERWNFDDLGRKGTPAYSADQLRTYGDQRAAEAREQMREECVNVFEGSSAITAKVTDELIEVIKELP